MNAEVRAVGRGQRDLLIAMYDEFDPLGAALGLPPWVQESRHDWVAAALQQGMNVAAVSPEGAIVGHCFLASGEPASAEIAVFVHQDWRRQGIGTALVGEVLERARAAGLRRVWATASGENRAALRLLGNCGFRVSNFAFPSIELEIELPSLVEHVHRAVAIPNPDLSVTVAAPRAASSGRGD